MKILVNILIVLWCFAFFVISLKSCFERNKNVYRYSPNVNSSGAAIHISTLSATITSSVKTLVRQDNTTSTELTNIYIPQEGSIEISTKDKETKIQDVVEFKVKDKGFSHSIGLQAAYPPAVGFDIKYAFYKRWGFPIGYLYQTEFKHGDINVGVSYSLSKILPVFNLEVVATYGLIRKEPYIGFRINL